MFVSVVDDTKWLADLSDLNLELELVRKEEEEQHEDSLNILRVPVSVYKYPVDGTFGNSYHGFEQSKATVRWPVRVSD